MAKGVEFDDIAERVAQVMDLPLNFVWEKSRHPQVVHARSRLCYWASSELGMRITEIAIRLGLSQPAVSIAARREEAIARQKGYFLLDK